MKKIRLAGLILLAPLTLLCACSGGTPLSFSANWYRNTALGDSIGQTHETLTYSVTFTPSETSEEGLTVEYDAGTYTTELINDNVTLADGSTKEGYIYTTELSISGRYRLGGEVKEFSDFVTSKVTFLPVGYGLQPVKSEKEVSSTSPQNAAAETLDGAVGEFHYTYDVTYDASLSTATAVYTDLVEREQEDGSSALPEPETREFDIAGDTTYLDNEQILFALRGLTLTNAVAFRTLNTVTGMVTEVTNSSQASAPGSVKESVDFIKDGEAVKQEIDAVELSLSYRTAHSGQPQKLVYAATTSTGDNTYRNVLLRMEVPVLQSLGTLVYRLTEADFTDK